MDSPDGRPGGGGGVTDYDTRADSAIRGVDPFFSYGLRGESTSAGANPTSQVTETVQWRIKGRPLLEDMMYPSLSLYSPEPESSSAMSSAEKDGSKLPRIYESPQTSPTKGFTSPSSSLSSFESPNQRSPSKISMITNRFVTEYQRVKKFEIDKLRNSHDQAARAKAAVMMEQEKEEEFMEGGFDGTIRWKVNIDSTDNTSDESSNAIFSPMKPTDKIFGYHRVVETLDHGAMDKELSVIPGELDIEGANQLRLQMQQKYRMEAYAKEKAKKEMQARKAQILLMSGKTFNQEEAEQQAAANMRRTSNAMKLTGRELTSLMAKLDPTNESGDELYARYMRSLEDKKKAVKDSAKKNEKGESIPSSIPTLSTLSHEEESYYRHDTGLKEILQHVDRDGERSELNQGVLFYRVRRELNTEEASDSDDDVYGDSFEGGGGAGSLGEGSYAGPSGASSSLNNPAWKRAKAIDGEKYPAAAGLLSSPPRSKQELRSIVEASLRKADKASHPVHIKRVNRAQNAAEIDALVEHDETELQRYARQLEQLYEEDAAHVTGSGDTKGMGDSLRSDSPTKRTRAAQDVLVAAQLQAGVLPERLLKQNEKVNKATIDAAAEGEHADENSLITIDLSKYGVGDVQGQNLGVAVDGMRKLHILLLSENRLTYRSVPGLFKNLGREHLVHIDLSRNDLHGAKHTATKAISRYFRAKNTVQRLNLSSCRLNSADLIELVGGFRAVVHQSIEELIVDDNDIDHVGVRELADYLSVLMTADMDVRAYKDGTIDKSVSALKKVSLAYNNISESGAKYLASAIKVNTKLKHIDLSANAISDIGAQSLAACIPFTDTLEMLNLSQNYVSSPSCFVFARVLKGHPSMKVLNLNRNPLGEPGARSIFRTIMKGLRCFVMMGFCTFPRDATMFNHNNPAVDSPYSLDLSHPYQASIYHNLLGMAESDPENCRLNHVTYQSVSSGAKSALAFSRNSDEQLCEKGSTSPYKPPAQGSVDVHVRYSERIPTLQMAAKDSSLTILEIIIVTAKSEGDQLNWLGLLCCDLYFTCAQAQRMIDNFTKKNVIGIGGLKKTDVIKIVWSRLLDTHNQIDFLIYNLPSWGRRTEIINYFGFDMFKFNWTNPSGHWRFKLDVPEQRNTFMKFVAINRIESTFSEFKSGREDTSQTGDWFNFRNATYDGQGTKDAVDAILNPPNPGDDAGEGEGAAANPNAVLGPTDVPPARFIIDRDFVENVPYRGTIEFDYVSTRRPEQETAEYLIDKGMPVEEDGFDVNDIPVSADDAANEDLREMNRSRTRSMSGEDSSEVKARSKSIDSENDDKDEGGSEKEGGPSDDNQSPPPTSPPRGRPTNKWLALARNEKARIEEFRPDPSRRNPADIIISDNELYDFLAQLGLSSRERCNPSECIFKLLYLQLAATKFYFRASHLNSVLDTFPREPLTQSRVVCALFSRIYDLHNMDVVLRPLWPEAQNDVIYRLGFLNVMNPLKPALDYEIHMLHQDNRRMLVYLLELAPSEAVNQLKEDLRSDIIITDLYGSLNRVIKSCTDQMVMFNYGDFNERTQNISWNLRRDGLKKFLVGTKPVSREIFNIIRQYYKLLQQPDNLSIGSVEQQYANMMKRAAERTRAAPLINKLRRIRKKPE